MIELTNGRMSSVFFIKFANSNFSRKVIPSFAKKFQIDLTETREPVESFQSLHDFFIRELQAGIHQIDDSANSVISPVDAMIEEVGEIYETAPIIVKGQEYQIAEMLGSEALAAKYLGGTYIVCYLSPKDYHRIHAPVSGTVTHTDVLGRKSYPVNKAGMKYGNRPLSKNYRQITEIKHDQTYVTMVKVGAMVVNTIVRTHEANELAKGDEVAYFSFGSTVVLLFEKDHFKLDDRIKSPYPIRMGERIGVI